MKNIFIILFFFSFLYSQNNEVLLSVQNKFKSLNGLSSDFNQSIVTKNKDNTTNIKGKVYYKKGNKIKLELEKATIISDGKTIWNYDKRLERVVISNANDNPSAFSIENYVFEYPKKCKLETQKVDNFIILILTPNSSKKDFKKAVLKINSENLVDEIEITDISETIYKINFINIQTKEIKDNFFYFNPPQGVNVVDLR